MSSSRQIEATAATWLARRDASGWSSEDELALTAWLAESTAHKVAFIRLEAAWTQSRKLKALGAGMPAGVIPRRGIWKRRRMPRPGDEPDDCLRESTRVAPAHRPAFLGIAAVLALIAVLGGGAWLLRPAGATYHTQVGGLEAIPMSDGSRVTLNTDTALRVNLTSYERRINLERGEAFFEVAHDPSRPFVVRAGDKRVVAVGTKFSVRRDADEVWVVVTEGKVRVESASAAGAPPAVLVPAGSRAHAHESAVLVSQEPADDAEAALSWRHGYVMLHDTPITEAAAEFNRYNLKKIVVGDPSIGDIRIGGNFRSTSTEAFVRLLSEGFPISVEERDDEIVLTRK